jgi:thiamine biosynthesis lipoprotein
MFPAMLLVFAALAQTPPEPAGTEVPEAERGPRLLADSRQLGGLQVQLTIAAPTDAAAREALGVVLAEVERSDALASDLRPSSEVSLVNRAAGGEPVAVGADVLALLTRGRELSKLTGRAFALSAGVLAPLWPFDAPASLRRPPDAKSLAAAVALIDDERIGLEVASGKVTLPKGVRLETRHLLRGYALGRGLAALDGHGASGALLAIGGGVAARGDKAGRPWIVGLQDPRGGGHFAVIPVKDEVVLTRGDYERYFLETDGTREHDALDPRTGKPARGCRSVTVVGTDPVLADVLASAVMVLGTEAGLRLLEGQPVVGAVIVTAGNEVVVTPGLQKRLRVVKPPSA